MCRYEKAKKGYIIIGPYSSIIIIALNAEKELKGAIIVYKKNLLSLGIPADFGGFEYLNYAIGIYKPLQKITLLYHQVGEHFGATETSVERCMRYAINESSDIMTVGRFVAKYHILWSEEV